MTGSLREVKVYTIGEPKIVTAAAEIDPSAHMTFAAAMFLALEGRGSVSRTRLENILWPSIDSSRASHRLRQTLLKLRRLGLEIDSVGKGQLRIGSAKVIVDFEAWGPDNPSASSRSHEFTPFGTYNPRISVEFSEWLERQRAAITSTLSHRILERIARHRLGGEWIAVESWCVSLLQIAPLNEEATLALAEALAMRGAKHSATELLDQYLRETGPGSADLKVQASLMRRRIGDRIVARSEQSHDAELVGRSNTMERLGGMLRSAKAGQVRVCLMVGDAGIGKSRVLSELAQFATLQGFTSVCVNARPSHLNRPLSTFVELVPLLRSLPGAIGCTAETLRFLELLTTHKPTRDQDRDSGDSAWIFSAVQTALFDLVDAVAEEAPLLIQLEDIHWADAASAEVLRELIHRLAKRRVFFALTARETPEEWQTVPSPIVETLVLEPLSTVQSSELVLSILRQCFRTMEKAYLDWCVTVAEGNPYFLTELANHWIETGMEHEVPASLSAVLKRRISRLDQDSLQVLQTCALLENNSSLARVEAVLQHDAHELLKSINTLGSAGMIVCDAADTTGANKEKLASRHELLSNVAVAQLTPPARQFLHRRIGQVLESEIDHHYSAVTLWDCAKHWQLAGDHKRALHLATSCAGHLMKVGLPTAAAQAYQRSLAFCGTDEERLEVLSGQAAAYYRMSAWVSLRETISKVRPLQKRCFPECSEHDELELMDMRAQWQSLNWDEILARALVCLKADNASPPHRCQAGVMALMLLGFQGDTPAMQNVFEKIEELGRDGDVTDATRLQARMVFHTNSGDINSAVTAARNLVTELEARGDIGELFRALCNAGVTCRVAGLFDEATHLFSNAVDIAKKHNLPAAEQRAIPLIANMALEIGDTANAKNLYTRLCALPLDATNRFACLERQALGERIALCEGRGKDARAMVPMTYKEAASDPIHHRRTYNLALYVVAEMAARGRVSEDAVKQLETSFAKSRASLHQAFSAFVLYAALLKTGQEERAVSLLKSYHTQHRREPWPAPVHLLETILLNCGLN
jgi:DNA-binding SARP family transcriptional activator